MVFYCVCLGLRLSISNKFLDDMDYTLGVADFYLPTYLIYLAYLFSRYPVISSINILASIPKIWVHFKTIAMMLLLYFKI